VNADHRMARRINGRDYTVETVSLADLLLAHNAPKRIDYLSIDIECGEFGILEAFDFHAFEVGIISCEHNCTPQREKIHALLRGKGFERRHEALSQWDEWYVRRSA